MYMLVIISLVVLQIFTTAIVIYLYSLTKKNKGSEVEPYSQFTIGVCALGFAIVILFLFYIFVDEKFDISMNLGQVGDFVGGLTNPVLSFIALIVLLRTTLIQTVETRKTSAIMLEQQKLFEQERFESSFYQLLERYEVSAERHWRKTQSGEKYTQGIAKILELKKRREEIDTLPIRLRLIEIKKDVRKHLDNDKDKKSIIKALKVFSFLKGSNLSEKRKKYYFSIMVDAMEPCELVMFLSMAFNSRSGRKSVRAYAPLSNLKREFFVSKTVSDYYFGS
ncbi:MULTISPECIES: hypothetical protein [Pseudomonas]|uniref:Phage abortive infection protein n=1 Tax=Pseudomonas pergaminensis TaxID=2853159 RepID=A0ABW8QWH2_9PSED|nr:hypothetical protein [Pseudomonas reactans]NWA68079.1 hypothetical protein [Pseudomonas reactans]